MRDPIARICLGTAQLGLPYGINNRSGKPGREQSLAIIRYALERGVRMFDTSPEYGDGETLLGDALQDWPDALVISKLPPIGKPTNTGSALSQVERALEKTLTHLRRSRIDVYLFHRFEDLMRDDGVLLAHLQQWRNVGVIARLGVSVYTRQEAEAALQVADIEVVQMPFSVFDRRPLVSASWQGAHLDGVWFLARSVFLQGLLFKRPVPTNLRAFEPHRSRLDHFAARHELQPAELALRYALSYPHWHGVVLGTEQLAQLKANLEGAAKGPLPAEWLAEIEGWPMPPRRILDPRLWKL